MVLRVGRVVARGCQVAAAGDGQLEAVYVEAFLVGVGQQPHKVMLL